MKADIKKASRSEALEIIAGNSRIKLHNDDNFQWQADSSIDLLLTDPPFNIARDTNFHTYEHNTINSYRFDQDKGWDTYTPESFRERIAAWAVSFERVLKPGGSFAVFCADEYLSDLIWSLRAAGLRPRRTITWRKPNAVPVNRAHMMMSACEYIVYGVKRSNATFNADLELANLEKFDPIESVFYADKAGAITLLKVQEALQESSRPTSREEFEGVISDAFDRAKHETLSRLSRIRGSGDQISLAIPNVVTFNSKGGKRIHPTEKPVPLLDYLIRLLSQPGDTVLDPFSGSGSTGVASIASGRDCILVEKDEDFFSLSSERIASFAETQSQSLF
jgi:site-specific DNA-methyltransferase (adenine-specific)